MLEIKRDYAIREREAQWKRRAVQDWVNPLKILSYLEAFDRNKRIQSARRKVR